MSCIGIFWCRGILAQVVPLFGAGKVIGPGPAPQNRVLRFPMAQVTPFFPHLRQPGHTLFSTPAPTFSSTCAKSLQHLHPPNPDTSTTIRGTYTPKTPTPAPPSAAPAPKVRGTCAKSPRHLRRSAPMTLWEALRLLCIAYLIRTFFLHGRNSYLSIYQPLSETTNGYALSNRNVKR